ncbi:MAG TPA: hypothetical protein VMQ65_03545 [Candidatus Limnocylindria bacterium]|nr:hypothetical protein [Candidatus Limnocylindria bacterium]
MERRSRMLGLAAAGAMLMASSAVAFAATPVQDGCPASMELLSVAELEESGPYQLPAYLDDPANGGNGDGYICGFPLPDAAFGPGLDFTIYQFFENNLPAAGRP